MDWTTGLTIAVSVLLAFAGYLVTYAYNLRLAQRKDRLERVNKQLSNLYGPLYALVSSSQACWKAFAPDTARVRSGHRPAPDR